MKPSSVKPEAPEEKREKAQDHSDVDSSFLRQMLIERRFMVAVVVVGVICVVAALGIPKIWTATPSGFEPKIRISGLDRLQSYSLARSATKSELAGRWDEAVQTWTGAVANNAADPYNSRGLVGSILRAPDPERRNIGRGIQQAFWLLRLTGTNTADLGLLAGLCEKYALDELSLGFLYEYRKDLGPEGRRAVVRAAYRLGNMDLFGNLWSESPAEYQKDSTLQVYHAAWSAGWGPVAAISEGRARLAKALQDPSTAALAHEVSLPLAASRQDAVAFQASLDYLVDHGLDSPGQHAEYWNVLMQTGRTAEAAARAKRLNAAPKTPTELIRIARLLRALGLLEDAIQLMQRHLDSFAYNTQVWVNLAELLGVAGRWDEVRILGVQLRGDPRQRVEVPGYGWFLEGYGTVKSLPTGSEERDPSLRNLGEVEFQQMLRSHISDPLIGYRCAVLLQEIGRQETAKKLFEGMEKDFGGQADYWFRLGLAAYQTDDIRLMLSANERAHQINPDNLLVINNLSAALLMLREQPAKAVELTLRRVAQDPLDQASRINHLLALVLNQRTAQARTELARFDPDRLPALEATLIHLAHLEIAVIEGKRDEALRELPRIEKRFLKAAQAAWLDRATEQLQTKN
jgi:tetratricopeptide (TPR) repeat protein